MTDPLVKTESTLCRLLREPLPPLARSMAPALVAGLPTLALVLEHQSLRITQLEGSLTRLEALLLEVRDAGT